MSFGGVIQGNLIGTDITGARAIPGSEGAGIGISLSGSSPVGGTDPNAANVIAGMDVGIGVGTSMATIQGNFIGVDAAQAGRSPAARAASNPPALRAARSAAAERARAT